MAEREDWLGRKKGAGKNAKPVAARWSARGEP